MENIALTQYSKGSGCGCKIAPADLEKILSSLPKGSTDPMLLVGNETKDDAAVYDLGNGTALISTTDFFTPIVNDAYDFGRIAAANAISDVYMMGGKPLMAIAILGWPIGKLPLEEATRVLEGAREIAKEAGIVIAGGHSIDIPEPVFGLSVNGLVHTIDLKKNTGAKPGDILFLTKPLGVGILSTAEKRGILKEEHKGVAVAQMIQLNKLGEQLGKFSSVHAMTDVTGFGLLGHLLEMCEGSEVSSEINYNDIPLIEGLKEYTTQFIYPDNTMRNWSAFSSKVDGIEGESLLTLCDPQTNGGILFSVALEEADQLENKLKKDFSLFRIGKITEKKNEKTIKVI